MPRKSRVFSSTGIYHIVLRSVNQHIIFEENPDYQQFLHVLSDCKTKHDIDIYAYCIMDNHIHLLLHSDPLQLPSFFQSLGSTFVKWYNNKYSRTGHLFQDRYHSTAIESKRQYLATLVYIHNNPVKANICCYPSEYRWSSYNAFYGEKNPLPNLSFSYDIAGTKESLLSFFSHYFDDSDNELFINDHRKPLHFLSDKEALSVFKSVTNLTSTSNVSTLNRSKRNQYIRKLREHKLTVNQIARIMDISPATVKRASKVANI